MDLNETLGAVEKLIADADETKNDTVDLRRFRSLRAIPPSLRKLSHLKKLHLTAGLEELPEWLLELTQLELLNISGCKISNLPEWISDWPLLNSLNLSAINLSSIPNSLRKLDLNSLDISRCNLPQIPEFIFDYKNLTSLKISGNQLINIGENCKKLKKIKSLGISACGLKELPDWICMFPELSNLEAHGNKISEIPSEIGYLSSLKNLDLHSNTINHIPDEISKLGNLINLSIANNPIKKLPASIGHLINLRSLSASSTGITKLPDSLTNLSELRFLSLSDTPITRLPKSIGKLKSLIGLDLSQGVATVYQWQEYSASWSGHGPLHSPKYQGLISLPESLSEIGSLTDLYLHGNEKLGIPDEILGANWNDSLHHFGKGKAQPSAILAYYIKLRKATLESKSKPLNEAKVLILGQPEAGKTSLIHALTKGCPTPTFTKTNGIARKEWVLNINKGQVVIKTSTKSEKLRLNLWDFGGQEIYKSTHTFFLTKRAVYIIVTTARKDTAIDQDLEDWLETAKTFGGGAPVWIAINKHDENPTGGPDQEALLRKYSPMLRGFIRTQCQDSKIEKKGAGLGISELRDRLVSEAWAMPDVRRPMTPQSMAIKRHLEKMKDATLSIESYKKICTKLGESGEDLQNTLLDLWDKLGTVRYFPENAEDAPVMRQTAILNPEWVTEAVYKVLEDELLKKANGLVTEADLDRIMHTLNHPTGSYHLIQNVMHRFSLLYDAGNGRMFIPQLLQEREPRMDWPANTLKFIYKYPVLPPGLVPSFIAQMHRSHDTRTPPWRNGCVLKLQGCSVRVIGDKKLRQVEISVAGGKNSQNRDALDEVRFKFESLHSAVTGMDSITELIPVPEHPNAPMLNYRFLRTLEDEGEEYHRAPIDTKSTASVKVDIAIALGSIRGRAMKEREAAALETAPFTLNIDIQNQANNTMNSTNNNNSGKNYGNIGSGNTLSISNSFNKIGTSHGPEIEKLFTQLHEQIIPLKDEMKGKDIQKLDEQLLALTKEAELQAPNKNKMEISANGLIEAAKTVSELAGPVISTTTAILTALGITS